MFVRFTFLGQREAGDPSKARPLLQLQSRVLTERLNGLHEDHLQTESMLTEHSWLGLVLVKMKLGLLLQLYLQLC